MTPRAFAKLALAGTALCGALAACSDDDSNGGVAQDAGEQDAGIDAPPDAAGSDASTDADAEPDADAAMPELGAPELVDLGTVSSGTIVELEVPDGALGFHVVVRRAAGGVVGIERITSPSGQDVVSDFTVAGFAYPSLAGNFGVGAASVPQNALDSAMPPEPGAWKLQFGGPASGEPLTAKVWIQKTEDGAFHGGVLDLNVYIPGGLELTDGAPPEVVTAASAPGNAGITTRIDSFFDALGSLYGISRGEVRFVDIGAEHRLLTLGEGLEDAFAATVTPDGPTAVHVVLANGISAGGQPVWGISAGIPGAAVEPGTELAGVALNVSLGFSPIADGWTLLHEVGHFSGLFHSTDPGGSDPLPDTPDCTTYPQACPDAKNIMYAAFWGASGGTGIVASDQQRSVVAGSALYRAYLTGTAQQRQWRAPPSPDARAIETIVRERNVIGCGHELAARRQGQVPQKLE